MSSPADAQMAAGLPKRFQFYGTVELSYKSYSTETKSAYTKRKEDAWIFDQLYKLHVDGYIYHPRLAVFNSYFTFRDTLIKTSYTNPNYKYFGSYLSVNLFPYRPVNLMAYILNTNFSGDAFPSGTTESSLFEVGAHFRSDYRRLPHIRLDYIHSEHERDLYKLKSDTWSFNIFDKVEKLKTYWRISLSLEDFSSPAFSYTTKYAAFNTSSILKFATLSAYMGYTDQNLYDSLKVRSTLYFKPGERFNHNYVYLYEHTKYNYAANEIAGIAAKTIDTKLHQMSGSWGYRITTYLSSGLGLNYNMHEENNRKWTSYGISPNISYHRPVATGIDMESLYRLMLKKDEERGNFYEHNLNIGLKYRRLRWGLIYTNYYFLKSYGEDKIRDADTENIRKSTYDATAQTFAIGTRGNFRGGAGKGYWQFEIQYQDIETNRKRELALYDDESFTENKILEYSTNVQQTTLSANIYYPFRRGASIQLKSGYTTGKANSNDLNQYFYEVRFGYPILRNLLLSTWYKDLWLRLANGVDSQTRNLELILNYRLGLTSLSTTYWLEIFKENGRQRTNHRIYFKLRRAFSLF
jgi:hypothetical protein